MEVNRNCTKLKLTELKKYKKIKMPVHVIESMMVPSQNEKIVLHTLEGDVCIEQNEDNYIMIGPKNDVYPISRQLFETKYSIIELAMNENDYIENIAEQYGWNIESIKPCILFNDSFVLAKRMDEKFSVFVKHCNEIIYGDAGDYYVVSEEDTDNAYIISAEIMCVTYEEM